MLPDRGPLKRAVRLQAWLTAWLLSVETQIRCLDACAAQTRAAGDNGGTLSLSRPYLARLARDRSPRASTSLWRLHSKPWQTVTLWRSKRPYAQRSTCRLPTSNSASHVRCPHYVRSGAGGHVPTAPAPGQRCPRPSSTAKKFAATSWAKPRSKPSGNARTLEHAVNTGNDLCSSSSEGRGAQNLQVAPLLLLRGTSGRAKTRARAPRTHRSQRRGS
jgi:hypothetical protein